MPSLHAVKARFHDLKLTGHEKILEIILEDLMILLAAFMCVRYYPKGIRILPFAVVVLILNTVRIRCQKQLHDAFMWMFRYRWPLAAAVFALLVLFQIHVSSAAAWSIFHKADPSVMDSVLFGFPRTVRSDEFNVQLPYFFSQYYNNFQEISHQMSVGGQDMLVGYNAPVANLTLIGKPLVWGYFLFGNDYGLAWYFAAKYVLMFMGSLEMFCILTHKKALSVFGAFFLTWAPGLQWWISPHFYDPIMYSVLLFVIGYYFFILQGWRKWLMTLLAIIALCGFVLGIFPSLQIPCGLLMLVLMICTLIRDKEQLVWKKSNLWNMAAVAVGSGIILIPAFLEMKDAMTLVMNTIYPGSRASTGGSAQENPTHLVMNASGYLQPFVNPDVLNNSEISSFTHFGIAYVFIYPFFWKEMKKTNNSQRLIGNVFFIALLIELIYLLFPIPLWLAKITLLSYVNRMNTVYGFTAAIATVWMSYITLKESFKHKLVITAICCAVYGGIATWCGLGFVYDSYLTLVPLFFFYLIPMVLAFTFWLCFTKYREIFFAAMTAWTFVTGCLVNPIVIGTASVHDYPVVEAASDIIEEDPDAWWLTLNLPTSANLLMANGAKVLNATNYYPDFEKWELLDPERQYEKYYNRYANIVFRLPDDDQETGFILPAPDSLTVVLKPDDLEKLPAKYLLAHTTDIPKLDQAGIEYEKLFEEPSSGEVIVELR